MRLIDADDFLEELKSSNISVAGCNSRNTFKIINEVKSRIISMLSVQPTISEINGVNRISELRKCPFCGGNAEFVIHECGSLMQRNEAIIYFYISCSDCKVRVPAERYAVISFSFDKKGNIINLNNDIEKYVKKWNGVEKEEP